MAGITDWCDVFVHPDGGPDAVRAGLLAGVVLEESDDRRAGATERRSDEGPSDGGPSDGGEDGGDEGPPPPPEQEWDGEGEPPERLRLPADHVARAHKYLTDAWLSRDGRSSELVSIGRQLYRYERDGGRWIRVSEDMLDADITRWTRGLRREKIVRRKDVEVTTWPPANLTNRETAEILKSVRKEVLVDVDGSRNDKGEIQPERFWLRSTERPADRYAGAPVFAARPWERVSADPAAEGLPSARMLMPLPDGILDLEAWDAGRVRRLPHATRLFCLNTFRHHLPWEALHEAEAGARREQARQQDECPTAPEEARRVGLAAFADAVIALSQGLAPLWWEFLARALGREPAEGVVFRDADDENAHRVACRAAYDAAMRELAKFSGYLLGADLSHQRGNILFLVGPPGTGKGTFGRGIMDILGEDNWAASSLEELAKPEFIESYMGRLCAYMPDERPHDFEEARHGGGVMKKISGQDRISCRGLFKDPRLNVRLFVRFLIGVNKMPNLAENALLRRMIAVEFARVIPRPDGAVEAAMGSGPERLGRLLWMLAGRLWLAQDGGFTQPEASWSVIDTYERQANRVELFVGECLEVTGEAGDTCEPAAIAELYAGYAAKVHGMTRSPPSAPELMSEVWPALRKLFPGSEHRIWRSQPRDPADKERRLSRYVGLRIKGAAVSLYGPSAVGAGVEVRYGKEPILGQD